MLAELGKDGGKGFCCICLITRFFADLRNPEEPSVRLSLLAKVLEQLPHFTVLDTKEYR